MKLWCRLFGHKKPWLFSLDGMRCICSRCGYRSFSVKAVEEFVHGGGVSKMICESAQPMMKFRQFEKVLFEFRIRDSLSRENEIMVMTTDG